MMKRLKIYSAGVCVFLFCVYSSPLADTAVVTTIVETAKVETAKVESANDTLVLDLVNQIREAPFSYGLSLGYDQAFLQDRQIFPETIFPSYETHEHLSVSAADANNNLAGNATEILTQAPVHLMTGEATGVVTFRSFMPLSTAAKIFIDGLFKSELESNNFARILSTDYWYAGTSVVSGITTEQTNGWFFAIDLGSFGLKSEMQILNMINQVRQEPWKIQAYISKDIIDFVSTNQAVLSLVSSRFSPLSFDTALHQSAMINSVNQLTQTGSASVSVSLIADMSPMDRGQYFGYQGQSIGESMTISNCARDNSTDCISRLFNALIVEELNTWPLDSLVFSNAFQDGGVSISILPTDETDLAAFSLVAGAREKDPGVSTIYGVLFVDYDGNSVYSLGEEIAKATVMVYDVESKLIKTAVTDNAGHFSMTLDADQSYLFTSESENYSVSKNIVTAGDRFVDLACSPSSSVY
jgi:hypothetical protein